MRNPLITYEWNSKKFTSEIRLWQLSRVGLITVKVEHANRYGQNFTYHTLDGQLIASYYKDDTFGHGSQATGIELKNAIPAIVLPDSVEWIRTDDIRFKKQVAK